MYTASDCVRRLHRFLAGTRLSKRSEDGYLEKIGLIAMNGSHISQEQAGSKPPEHTLDEPGLYEIKVAQSLSDQWTAWFDGLEIVVDAQRNSILRGTIIDQAALHGVLRKIRDLNLVLLSVTRK